MNWIIETRSKKFPGFSASMPAIIVHNGAGVEIEFYFLQGWRFAYIVPTDHVLLRFSASTDYSGTPQEVWNDDGYLGKNCTVHIDAQTTMGELGLQKAKEVAFNIKSFLKMFHLVPIAQIAKANISSGISVDPIINVKFNNEFMKIHND
jgi:hypothetical protein